MADLHELSVDVRDEGKAHGQVECIEHEGGEYPSRQVAMKNKVAAVPQHQSSRALLIKWQKEARRVRERLYLLN